MATRQADVSIIGWVFLIASGIMVGLRLLSRVKLSNQRGWDDLWLSLAWAVIFIDTCIASYAAAQGMGVTLKVLMAGDPDQMVKAIKWSVITLSGNIFVFTFPKPAIALLLGRILKLGTQTSAMNGAVLYGPSIIIVLWSFATFGVWLGQCQPIAGLWDKRVTGMCLDPHVFLGLGMSISTASAFLDFFYGLFPVFFITKLQMDWRRKVHLSIMLGLGCVGGAVAVWKITQLPAGVNPQADVTWNSAALVNATLIEGNVIIIMACVPTIGPVVREIRKHTGKLQSKLPGTTDQYRQFDGSGYRMKRHDGSHSAASMTSEDPLNSNGRNGVYELQPSINPVVELERGYNRSDERVPRSPNEIIAKTTINVHVAEAASQKGNLHHESGW